MAVNPLQGSRRRVAAICARNRKMLIELNAKNTKKKMSTPCSKVAVPPEEGARPPASPLPRAHPTARTKVLTAAVTRFRSTIQFTARSVSSLSPISSLLAIGSILSASLPQPTEEKPITSYILSQGPTFLFQNRL